MESELDSAERFPGWEADEVHPGLAGRASGSSREALLPAGKAGSANLDMLPRGAPAFESGGRHILYCGTDLSVDNAHWVGSPRKHALSKSADNHAAGAHMARGLGKQSSDVEEGGDGEPGKRMRSNNLNDVSGEGRGRGSGSGSGASAGGGQGGEVDEEEDDEEVLELEADTPGGYHVTAMLTHHRNAKDPEEITVEAHIHP